MAGSLLSGFDCNFVVEPPDDFIQSECPVCLQILREPYQVSCCGNSFCQVCIGRIKTEKMPCPTCKDENFSMFADKRLRRSLYGIEVYCSHKEEGCEWKGELGQIDNHLNLSPQPDKKLEGCEYSEIECIHCSELIKRSNITVHQNDLCPKRPFSCEYCSYESDYEDVTLNHMPVCGYHPNTVIDCDFHHVGCDVRLPRKDMPVHLKENLVTHMSLQTASYSKLLASYKQLEEKLVETEKEKKTAEQERQQNTARILIMEQQIATLQQAESMAKKQLKHATATIVLNGYVEFKMENFKLHKRDKLRWFSLPFYTHNRGYRLFLRVDANGSGRGEGTHVSVFVGLRKGEYDDHLKWPFHGYLRVKLVDQSEEDEEKKEFQAKTIDFNQMPERHDRVRQGVRSDTALGSPKFISHSELEPKYLVKDCLCFRVTWYKEHGCC